MKPAVRPASEFLPDHRSSGSDAISIEDLFHDPIAHVGFRQIQLSGSATSSIAVALVGGCLAADERPAAWVLRTSCVPFPADMHDAGVDPRRLLFLSAPSAPRAEGAADIVLRSGCFCCLVYEIDGSSPLSLGIASRFMHVCRRYRTMMVLIGPDRSVSTIATVAYHVESEVAYGTRRQSIRIGIRRGRGMRPEHEVEAHGPDYLYPAS